LIIGFSKILELFLFVHEFTPLSSQKWYCEVGETIRFMISNNDYINKFRNE
jgi:hypothetical protein